MGGHGGAADERRREKERILRSQVGGSAGAAEEENRLLLWANRLPSSSLSLLSVGGGALFGSGERREMGAVRGPH